MLKTTLNKILFPTIGYISCSKIQSNCASNPVFDYASDLGSNYTTSSTKELCNVVIRKKVTARSRGGVYLGYTDCSCNISFKYPTTAKNMSAINDRIESLVLEQFEYYDWKTCKECTEYQAYNGAAYNAHMSYCRLHNCRSLDCRPYECTTYNCNAYEEDIKNCIENAIPNCTIENIKFDCERHMR